MNTYTQGSAHGKTTPGEEATFKRMVFHTASRHFRRLEEQFVDSENFPCSPARSLVCRFGPEHLAIHARGPSFSPALPDIWRRPKNEVTTFFRASPTAEGRRHSAMRGLVLAFALNMRAGCFCGFTLQSHYSTLLVPRRSLSIHHQMLYQTFDDYLQINQL